jgi:hypothetical protein
VEPVADLVVATADLCEAEARAFRRGVLMLIQAIACIVAASLLALIGLGFVLYGLFIILSRAWSVPTAAWVIGAAAIVLAGGLTWMARKLTS